MKRIFLCGLGISALLMLVSLYTFSLGNPPEKTQPAAEELFHQEIQPLLKAKCLGCHGDEPDKLSGGLDLRSRDALLKGGDNGAVLVPGNSAKSSLYHTVLRRGDIKMPPKEESKLTPKEIAALKTWIDAGAPWPAAKQVADNWKIDPKDAWAFLPVKKVPVPKNGVDSNWIKTPVDAFISQKLSEKRLKPAPLADKITLIRRVTYTLTGLPPTPEEVDAFLKDDSPAAFQKVIDRLLASPRYGEHWARHWLDVVRYSDSAGYSNDFERPNAWRYRDYVIRSFNQDKPYDQFIKEQIAGDEIEPSNPENLIAVGFLRMGPWEHTGMSVKAVTRQMFLDDVTNSVGTTFLAMPLTCCRCHDHKFDPIPTKDYYRVQACFTPIEFEERPANFLPAENTAGFAKAVAEMKKRIQATQAKLKAVDQEEKEVQEELRRAYQKRLAYYKLAEQRYLAQAFSVASGGLAKKIKPQDVFILAGGNLANPGEKVNPGVISAVYDSDDSLKPTKWNTVPQTTDGRRLALAEWIASPKNPLTARVMVNRIWQHHFGRGLVETSNTFGKMGKRPTHPELLDWLADYFVEHGWSVKAMHRLILSAAVYQMSDTHPDMESLRKVDPLNQRLAYFPPHRLTAEELRDSILAVSGQLSSTTGGPPVYPEINWDVALQPRQIMGALAPIYEPSPKKEQRNSRTIFTVQIRTLGNPFLEVFNAPNMDAACEFREESTVTPQVFTLFNSEFSHDMALALAVRLEQHSKERAEQIRFAFRLVYGRPPNERELALCVKHLETMLEHHRKNEPVRKELPKTIVRERIAEFTGALVKITEDWDSSSYERNLKAWDVGPETRALAEVCLVLLNSNEFVYVH
jgi:hypothetical protein